MNVLISGGGIAGLSAGILLSREGFKVTVFERSSELDDLGTGVQISPNGYKILQLLGVDKKIVPDIFEPDNIHLRDGFSGKIKLSVPVKKLSRNRWGGKYFNIKRFDLLRALLDELKNYKSSKIHFGKSLIQYEQTKKNVIAILEDGSKISGDILIGADGVFSKIRQQIFSKTELNYSGNFAWRGLADASKINCPLVLKNNLIWIGPKKHAVTTILKNGSLINFVGIVEKPAENKKGKPSENQISALEDFRGWHEELITILNSANSIHRWPIYSARPFKKWSDGKVILIGDAAHPMVPSMAQGAVQALEDAAILSNLLAKSSDVTSSLSTFHKTRINRTSKIQSLSKRNLQTFHLPNSIFRNVMYFIAFLLSKILPSLIRKRFDWVYAYETNFTH